MDNPEKQELSQEITSSYIPDTLEQRRKEFVSDLVNCGEIDLEFAQSGVLDRFNIDEPTGVDSLKHILVGEAGSVGANGIHHLRSIIATRTLGRLVASRIDPEKAMSHSPDDVKAVKKLRNQQKVRKDGTFRPFIIGVEDGSTGKGSIKYKTGGTDTVSREGSTMFPNEWSAQHLISAVVGVADVEPNMADEDRRSYVHISEIDGVRIRVITSMDTGKIITAYPILRKN